MKKLLALALLAGSSALFVSSAEAKTANAEASVNATNASYTKVEQPRRFGRVRVVTTTRNVRRGRFLYRETYRTTYFASGRVNRRLISRVVISR